ncbi:hypothetical protein Dimus_016569, partial [Dionaea muscipula]
MPLMWALSQWSTCDDGPHLSLKSNRCRPPLVDWNRWATYSFVGRRKSKARMWVVQSCAARRVNCSCCYRCSSFQTAVADFMQGQHDNCCCSGHMGMWAALAG